MLSNQSWCRDDSSVSCFPCALTSIWSVNDQFPVFHVINSLFSMWSVPCFPCDQFPVFHVIILSLPWLSTMYVIWNSVWSVPRFQCNALRRPWFIVRIIFWINEYIHTFLCNQLPWILWSVPCFPKIKWSSHTRTISPLLLDIEKAPLNTIFASKTFHFSREGITSREVWYQVWGNKKVWLPAV
jgi:hypothetical protein